MFGKRWQDSEAEHSYAQAGPRVRRGVRGRSASVCPLRPLGVAREPCELQASVSYLPDTTYAVFFSITVAPRYPFR